MPRPPGDIGISTLLSMYRLARALDVGLDELLAAAEAELNRHSPGASAGSRGGRTSGHDPEGWIGGRTDVGA
jgi:hypothetical protein